MLLAVASMARIGEAGTLVAGNTASKDQALQASEIGVGDAYAALDAAVSAGTSMDTDVSTWYRASYAKSNDTAAGVPNTFPWTSSIIPAKTYGEHNEFSVKYVVERYCTTTPVTDQNAQCMLKKTYSGDSTKSGVEALEAAPGVQYRVTVRVAGPKEGITFVQSFVTR
jgi:hypothetical protein